MDRFGTNSMKIHSITNIYVVPTKIESNDIVGLRVVSISCGLAFSGAILGSTLFMWGKNDKGQVFI